MEETIYIACVRLEDSTPDGILIHEPGDPIEGLNHFMIEFYLGRGLIEPEGGEQAPPESDAAPEPADAMSPPPPAAVEPKPQPPRQPATRKKAAKKTTRKTTRRGKR